MTGLLVSVRSPHEAEVALAGGADIIDIKEPARGALGPADPSVWKDVLSVVGRRAKTSAALGELLFDPVDVLASQTAGFAFVKIGLAGCAGAKSWLEHFESAAKQTPDYVQVVPVAYADWRKASAPRPELVVDLAARCSGLLLVDTFDKRGGSLLEVLTWTELISFAQVAKRAGVSLALAGSLTVASIGQLLSLHPSYVGVRGAACTGGRGGTIELARVKALADAVRQFGRKAAS